ncbi:hypothetical protein BKA56DRAFT_589707 [Ilyonectria sp. MPI-CAGE-AT-0026]|nr:hypothetical protein BKA56DRAFT_589707 [Ilyonectria sp. MPI-CAGE-AT-0026]
MLLSGWIDATPEISSLSHRHFAVVLSLLLHQINPPPASRRVGFSKLAFRSAFQMAARRFSQRRILLAVPVLTFLSVAVALLVLKPDLPPLSLDHILHPPPPPAWEVPDVDPIIHGVHASDYEKTEHPYSLTPFPDSPLDRSPPKDKNAPWLAAVICTPWDVERRMLIRSSWMRIYKELPFDGRFVLSNPGPQWMETIKLENSTFGDLIVLDALREDDFTANTVKTLGFYHWLLEKSPKQYQFVSKMDTDLWLNARGFWDRFLSPRLTNDTSHPIATVNNTIIGQLYYSPPHKVVFPHGSMYTVTWDMVELLAGLQDTHHVIAGEDMAMAMLMLKGRETATVVNMKGSEKFDFDERDTRPGEDTAWAVGDTIPSAAEHALYGDEVIAVHQLKSDEAWLKVADCFDENGIKEMPEWTPPPPPPPPPPMNEEETRKWQQEADKKKMKYNKSRFDAIPAEYWEFKDGTWLCNGIWKTQVGVEKNPEIQA